MQSFPGPPAACWLLTTQRALKRQQRPELAGPARETNAFLTGGRTDQERMGVCPNCAFSALPHADYTRKLRISDHDGEKTQPAIQRASRSASLALLRI